MGEDRGEIEFRLDIGQRQIAVVADDDIEFDMVRSTLSIHVHQAGTDADRRFVRTDRHEVVLDFTIRRHPGHADRRGRAEAEARRAIAFLQAARRGNRHVIDARDQREAGFEANVSLPVQRLAPNPDIAIAMTRTNRRPPRPSAAFRCKKRTWNGQTPEKQMGTRRRPFVDQRCFAINRTRT